MYTINKIKAIIFDVDGVIIDYEPLSVKMYLDILGKYTNKEKFLKEDYLNVAGTNVDFTYNYFKNKYNIKESFNQYYRRREHLKKKYTKQYKLMPNILILLEYLKKKGLKLGIATSSNKEKIKQINKKFPEVLKFFDVITTKEEVSKAKPDPEIFLKTAKKLKVKPEETIVIEDSINGLHAAIAGNFIPIILKNPYISLNNYLPRPFAIVNNLIEIKKILEHINTWF